ncbi:Pentatricopeptide repeat-containing protein [Apostasia shenzhenica]|uniref:Pentatricopeptide repeat-containing protein n=1 Tax=Apostasia shenzhenica TaxID=1088818 RepID=A0A2I0ACD9_9ASPA|nr:Pentatricopeptide repeat-containing protein [Apostasia shenzhenica]
MTLTSLPIDQRLPKLLRRCTFEQLKQIHCFLLTSSLAKNSALSSLCIRRAADLGDVSHAHLLFSFSGECPHILSWNALIRGCVQSRHYAKAIQLFVEMPKRDLSPNEFTFFDLFAACAALGVHGLGKQAHCRAVKSGVDLVPLVTIPLFKFYSAMASSFLVFTETINARKIFDGFASKSIGLWKRMLWVYVGIGDISSARKLFDEMPDRDVVSWNMMLSGYARSKDAKSAGGLFHIMPERNVFSWTTMVGALADSGDVPAARKLFDEMPVRNVVSWNCMMSSYTQSGRFKQAIDLFFLMQSQGVSPDGFTFVAVLSACAHLGALKAGRWIHLYLIGNWIKFGAIVATSLVEMYASCGDIDSALTIFIKTEKKDVFCWNVMIKALASHGRASAALHLFSSMKKEKLQANDFTFMSVLFACSHGGLVDEGRRIFVDMERVFKIKPKIDHYGCLIDLLSRGGLVEEALRVVKEMPYKPDTAVWGALLGGCSVAGSDDAAMAKKVMERVKEEETDEGGVYAILSNMYAASSQWGEAMRAREKMEGRRIHKNAGCSCVQTH